MSQNAATKEQRALQILAQQPIASGSRLASGFRTTLMRLHERGEIDCIDGIYYAKRSAINLSIGGLDDLMEIAHFLRDQAERIAPERDDAEAVFFRVNGGGHFPITVGQLRGLLNEAALPV